MTLWIRIRSATPPKKKRASFGPSSFQSVETNVVFVTGVTIMPGTKSVVKVSVANSARNQVWYLSLLAVVPLLSGTKIGICHW